MGVGGVVFALFAVGYILGVWTAFVVLRQPQGVYEDVPAAQVILLREGDAQRVPRRL